MQFCEYVEPVKIAEVQEAHGSSATEVNEQAIRKKKILKLVSIFVRIRQRLYESRPISDFFWRHAHPPKDLKRQSYPL